MYVFVTRKKNEIKYNIRVKQWNMKGGKLGRYIFMVAQKSLNT